jgi:prepilin-type N-terminal cleavage/methylation domain-containing protein
MFNNKKGFTLIELLVVIAVIGILSTVVLVLLSGVREDARDARRMSDLTQIGQAMEMYNISAGSYPDTAPGTDTVTSIGTYLSVVPTDPSNVSPYQYDWEDGTTAYYCVHVQLEGTAVTTYYCASSEGTASDTSDPNLADCCGFDLTD